MMDILNRIFNNIAMVIGAILLLIVSLVASVFAGIIGIMVEIVKAMNIVGDENGVEDDDDETSVGQSED